MEQITPAGAAPAAKPLGIRVGALLGMSLPINGFNYYAGIGVRAGMHFGHIYAGAMLAVHQGDSTSINWNATALQPAGTQTYSSIPLITAIDGGYRFDIPIGSRKLEVTPYLSTGVIATTMQSSGVYGDSSIVNTDFVIGGGLGVVFPLNERIALGVHSRTYNVGDTSFHYGDASQGTYEHGFSTSIFYTAWFSEIAFTF